MKTPFCFPCPLGALVLIAGLNRKYLMGHSIGKGLEDDVTSIVRSFPSVLHVWNVQSQWISPTEFSFKAGGLLASFLHSSHSLHVCPVYVAVCLFSVGPMCMYSHRPCGSWLLLWKAPACILVPRLSDSGFCSLEGPYSYSPSVSERPPPSVLLTPRRSV